MLKNDTRKVYIVNNIKSDNIEQVIFILRTDNRDKKSSSSNQDIAFEAQAIIDNYAKEIENISVKHPSGSAYRRKKKHHFYKYAVTVTIIASTLLLFVGLLSKFIY